MTTQKGKLDFLERAFDKKKPYKANYGIAYIGLDKLIYIWRCLTTFEIIKSDGSFADVNWIVDTVPSREVILELAGIVAGIKNVNVLWEELEE